MRGRGKNNTLSGHLRKVDPSIANNVMARHAAAESAMENIGLWQNERYGFDLTLRVDKLLNPEQLDDFQNTDFVKKHTDLKIRLDLEGQAGETTGFNLLVNYLYTQAHQKESPRDFHGKQWPIVPSYQTDAKAKWDDLVLALSHVINQVPSGWYASNNRPDNKNFYFGINPADQLILLKHQEALKKSVAAGVLREVLKSIEQDHIQAASWFEQMEDYQYGAALRLSGHAPLNPATNNRNGFYMEIWQDDAIQTLLEISPEFKPLAAAFDKLQSRKVSNWRQKVSEPRPQPQI